MTPKIAKGLFRLWLQNGGTKTGINGNEQIRRLIESSGFKIIPNGWAVTAIKNQRRYKLVKTVDSGVVSSHEKKTE